MALLTAVLVSVLATSQYSTWRSFEQIIEEAFETAIANPESLDFRSGQARMPRRTRVIVADYKIGDDGLPADDTSSTAAIGTEDISAISAAAAGPEDEGRISERHLLWRKVAADGGWRIVVADTAAMDTALFNQFRNNAVTIMAALVVLSAITWQLSSHIVAPTEEAMAKQRRFVADASHELKTPLSAIIANTQILMRNLEKIPEPLRKWVLATDEEASSMQHLVTDLLDLAKSEDGGAKRRHEPVDLSEIVAAAALSFDAIAYERGCTIEAEVSEGVRITGDPDELRRMAETLIDNACKHAAPGSAVRISLARSSGRARLDVANEGEPISAEDLPHVFDRFWKSDSSRTREGEGSYGLGFATP